MTVRITWTKQVQPDWWQAGGYDLDRPEADGAWACGETKELAIEAVKQGLKNTK